MNGEIERALLIFQTVMLGVLAFISLVLTRETNQEIRRLSAEVYYTKSQVRELEKEIERTNNDIEFVTIRALNGEWDND